MSEAQYYVRQLSEGPIELWRIEARKATRCDTGYCFDAADGEDIWQCLRRLTGWFDGGANPFVALKVPPGYFHPRIARPQRDHWPHAAHHPANAEDAERIAQSSVQLASLASSLQLICRTVEPKGDNLYAWGHDIRNLLILACTEVEAALKGVLAANGHRGETTRDYVKLAAPLRLKEYSAFFPSFPGLGEFRPFVDWDASKSTQTLSWYDAYNSVKHDRENYFERATLLMAFEAVSACAILLGAQYGAYAHLEHSTTLPTVQLRDLPLFGLEDLYVASPEGAKWTPTPLTL